MINASLVDEFPKNAGVAWKPKKTEGPEGPVVESWITKTLSFKWERRATSSSSSSDSEHKHRLWQWQWRGDNISHKPDLALLASALHGGSARLWSALPLFFGSLALHLLPSVSGLLHPRAFLYFGRRCRSCPYTFFLLLSPSFILLPSQHCHSPRTALLSMIGLLFHRRNSILLLYQRCAGAGSYLRGGIGFIALLAFRRSWFVFQRRNSILLL